MKLLERAASGRGVVGTGYIEYFSEDECACFRLDAKMRKAVERLDQIVDDLRALLSHENIISLLREFGGKEIKQMELLYQEASQLIAVGICMLLMQYLLAISLEYA